MTMRWIKPVLFGVAILVGAGAFGLAKVRPDLLPSWARDRIAPKSPKGASDELSCAEHGVPERYCTLCHEQLKETLPACKEHGGLPEAICTRCHPEAERTLALEMCPRGHGLPKSYCVDCQAEAKGIDDGWCSAHNRPESACADCQKGKKPEATCRVGLPMVVLSSTETAGQIGLETAKATAKRHADTLAGNAEISYATHDYAHVTSRVSGRISAVPTDEGQVVRKGQVLVVVDSAEVGSAKAQYLALLPIAELAKKTLDRTLALRRTNSVAEKEELNDSAAAAKADADLLNARQRLKNLGFTDAELKKIEQTKDTSNFLDIVAPMDGTLVERHAIPGETVVAPGALSPGQANSLYELVNLDHLWCWIDIYENQIDRVAIGQPVSFTISGTETPVFRGKVELIGFAVNPVTRTVRVRAELANLDGRLRASQFGRAVIQVSSEHDAILVPKSAVQDLGKVSCVFLPQPDGKSFRPQRVEVKPTDWPSLAEITWGLKPGDEVVTTGSFLMKSELLKTELGRGCCQ